MLRVYNGLMWLAANGALTCLLLEHVVPVPSQFSSYLQVRMIIPLEYYYYYYYYYIYHTFTLALDFPFIYLQCLIVFLYK